MERTTVRNEHLIIQTAFIGDLLLSLPLLREMRRLFPEDKLILFCRKGLGDLVLRLGVVDEVIEADKSSRTSWSAAVARARSRSYETLICPHQSTRSLLLAWRVRARRKIGYASFIARWIWTDALPRPLELPEALRQLALLAPLDPAWPLRLASFAHAQSADGGQAAVGLRGNGLEPVPAWASLRADGFSRGRLSEASRTLIARYGLDFGRWVFIAPGSVWPTKRWTEEGFAEVAAEFLRRGFHVAAIGAPNEREICERLAARVPGVVSLAGLTDLFESGELLSLAHLLICNDSGAMHLAAAAGTPTVAIFGPTVLEFGYRPWQDFARVVQIDRARLECRPCGKHGSEKCPIGTHACMVDIKATDVLKAADEVTADAHR